MQIGKIVHLLIINNRKLFDYFLEQKSATETAIDNNNIIISREEFMEAYEFCNIYDIPKIYKLLNNNHDLEYVWFQK